MSAPVTQGTAGPADGPLLTLKNIEAGYGGVSVLRDVSISVPAGSVVAVLGPNGAGKTTVLRVATGLVRAGKGSVEFIGEDVTRLPAHLIAVKGLLHIPEGRGIFPTLTVKENLRLAAPKGQESATIQQAAELFPVLGKRLRQTAGSMSGGEQQMLALARAIVRQPSILVVDEASLGLAPIVVDRIYEVLRLAVQRGTSMLIVEQYVTRALDFADFVYVLNHGAVVHAGPADEIDADELVGRYLGQASRHENLHLDKQRSQP